MKKTKSMKRLNVNREVLRSLQLQGVTGGGVITAPSKPQASCFIVCVITNTCPTNDHCVFETAHC